MKILGIETSTEMGSVALMEERGLREEWQLSMAASHTERLLATIDRLFKDCRITVGDLTAIAFSLGPGSYTSLRVGLATVKGLALAYQKPVVALSTLEVLAWNLPYSCFPVCPMVDARKKEVFSALFRYREPDRLERLTADGVFSPPEVLALIKEPTVFLGNGAELYRTLLTTRLGDKALFAPAAQQWPKASVVAELGLKRFQKGDVADLHGLSPVYLRRSDAEIAREKILKT